MDWTLWADIKYCIYSIVDTFTDHHYRLYVSGDRKMKRRNICYVEANLPLAFVNISVKTQEERLIYY
jgi:hypothetical protein